ncbi:MAG: hypothetical protein AAB784_02200, partial [Patescibacteria group bacterium]
KVKGDIIAEGIKKTYYSVADLFPNYDLGVLASNWLSRDISISQTADSQTRSLFSGSGAQAADQSRVGLEDNGNYLATYGVDSTRGEIQLSGTSDLVFGEAKVYFDYSFTELIASSSPIKVLITPTTRINGQLYVDQKTPYGFVVKELNAASNGKFDWLVIARRKGYEGTDGAIPNSQFPIPNETAVPPSPSPSSEPVITESPTPEPSASPLPEATAGEASPTPTPSTDSTSSLQAGSGPTPTASATPEPTPSPTLEPSVSPIPEPTLSSTPEPTPESSPSESPTPSPTPELSPEPAP